MAPGAEQEPPPVVDVRMMLIFQGIIYLILMGYVFFVVRMRHRLAFWPALGWRSVQPSVFLLAGLVLAFAVNVIPYLLRIEVDHELPIERLFHSPEAAYMLAAFGVLVAPLVEELIFRGFLFVPLERMWGANAAIWATAILFATIHVPQLRGGVPQIIIIFLVGLILSWVRARTGSLAAPYYMHLAYNATLFMVLYRATDGFEKFGRGP
jgi:uncharacterized protein